MRKKSTTSQSGFFGSRVLLAVMLCMGIACLVAAATSPATSGKLVLLGREAPGNAFQRTLTFEERVSYQRIIEDVYWRHRIWPRSRGENSDPKPSLDAVMTQAELEKAWTESYSPERNASALDSIADKPMKIRVMHFAMRLFFRGIYFPQMTKRAWIKLMVDNRRSIFKLVRAGIGEWRATKRKKRLDSAPAGASIQRGDASI